MKAHGHDHEINVKKVDRLSPTRVRMTVEFSGDELKSHESMTANQYLRIAQIPGFRPGKAPMKLVMQKYRDQIRKDVVSHLVEAGLQKAFEQTKLVPVNQPRIQLGEVTFEPAKPLEFHAEFEVQPEIELKSYKGVPLTKPNLEVSEEEVSNTLNNIRERMASLEPLEAKKPEKGNFVVAEIGYRLNEENGRVEAPRSYTVEVGNGRLLNELDEALLSTETGASKEVTLKFPEEYEEKDLRGKEATFSVKVLELKKKVLPELTDELANQLKAGSTLQSLKDQIREDLVSSKKGEHDKATRNQIIDYLIANNSFEVPSSMVDRQSMHLLQWMMEDLKRRGQAFPSLKEDEVKAVRTRAEQMVRSSLLLREVAAKEQILLDEEKFQEKLNSIAGQLNRSVEETKKLLHEQNSFERIKDEVLTDQVFDFLTKNAQFVESSPRP